MIPHLHLKAIFERRYILWQNMKFINNRRNTTVSFKLNIVDNPFHILSFDLINVSFSNTRVKTLAR